MQSTHGSGSLHRLASSEKGSENVQEGIVRDRTCMQIRLLRDWLKDGIAEHNRLIVEAEIVRLVDTLEGNEASNQSSATSASVSTPSASKTRSALSRSASPPP